MGCKMVKSEENKIEYEDNIDCWCATEFYEGGTDY